MIYVVKCRKAIACFFLSLLLVQTLTPLRVHALTSGPVAPEARQFSPAGVSDMVDLFSGGFKYDIPLLDIDGYPVNLNYASGTGMEDEASWVGLGWNLNVGAINRQLRGIPDDFSGDSVRTEHYTKPNVTIGGKGTIKGELAGWNAAGLSGSLSVGVFSDNYRGIGAEVGANVGIFVGEPNSMLTSSLGVGVNSNTSSGVDVKPLISLGMYEKATDSKTVNMGLSASLGYNTRQGLKALNLGASFGVTGKDMDGVQGSTNYDVAQSVISFNTPPFTPNIGIGYRNTSSTYSVDIGGVAWIAFAGVGMTGYKSTREIISTVRQDPEYGYMYAEKGVNRDSALLDCMREKDNPVITSLPNLAVPVITPDLFSYSGQAGSGQFRLFRNSTGVVNDPAHQDITKSNTDGLDLGLGGYVHGGVSLYNQNARDRTGKWRADNNYNAKGDYQSAAAQTADEASYFKVVGEKNTMDPAFLTAIHGESAVKVSVTNKLANASLVEDHVVTPVASFKKSKREIRRTSISYLTAGEMPFNAANAIYNYNFLEDTTHLAAPYTCNGNASSGTPGMSVRQTGVRARHHLSQITVNGDDGRRMVYGQPVYNLRQDEYTFATNGTGADAAKNLVPYTLAGNNTINHTAGVDNYYHHEITPAYAASFLLTAVLSPDYVDVTGDGITDDDMGTAVKFNYSQAPATYNWRTPIDAGKATYNRGLNADPDDDKGSIIFGQRELCYLQSIETRTKIAYFITEARNDAIGVTDFNGVQNTGSRQRYLKEIRLYSKADPAKPIKTVVLNYDYSLCPNIPNGITAGQGKLTLKSLYFKYGSSTKGKHHPYFFEYTNNQGYDYMCSDRWGTFKPVANNALAGLGALRNDQFPYSTQDSATAAQNAAKWNLNKITLPSGGVISVDYESNDYAYVQDQRAMAMVKVQALINENGGASSIRDAAGISVDVDDLTGAPNDATLTRWFIQRYLNGHKEMYTKLYVNMTTNNQITADAAYDYVPCYASVKQVKKDPSNPKRVWVLFEPQSGGNISTNPMELAAWQKMRTEYPRYAYPGYNNRAKDNAPFMATLTALVNSIKNLSELWENFDQKAYRKAYASTTDLSKSFVRVVKGNGIKMGGGVRVKRIAINDRWAAMSAGLNYSDAVYGQEYEYRTETPGGLISSGVASYEPGIGNDENSLHLPVPYTQNIRGALSNEFYLEQPFGEALYPGPQVGYSHVVVRDLDETHKADALYRTGYTAHDFYTAKDFPVEVSATDHPLVSDNHPSSGFGFFGANIRHEVSMSQGYVVRLNDMHGKPKGDYTYNMSKQLIASTEYHYSSEIADAGRLRLKNTVDVIDENGLISPQQTIGREIEMYADMRESKNDNDGKTIQIGADVVPGFWGIPFPLPHWPRNNNSEHELLRTACIMKVIQCSGIMDKVVKMINGSTVTSRNLLYDRNTGEAVVTQTNNEFDDPVYAVTMPAYWAYGKMGGAYKTLNATYSGVITNGSGVLNAIAAGYMTPGDEVMDLQTGKHYWVISSGKNSDTSPAGQAVRLVDNNGSLKRDFSGYIKVYRSGYRNQLTSGTASFAMLNNPVSGSDNPVFDLRQNLELAAKQVVSAQTTLYDENWGQRRPCATCPAGYALSTDGLTCVKRPDSVYRTDFQLAAGSVSHFYGDRGAFIFDAQGNITDSVKGSYWGGACSGTNSVTAGITTLASAGDSLQLMRLQASSETNASPAAVQVESGCGRLYAEGIWWAGTSVADVSLRGFITCVNLPRSGDFYLGFGADNYGRVYIDDQLIDEVIDDNYNNLEQWRIRPFHVNTAGQHQLRVEARNRGTETAVAAQIYNTTNKTDLINSKNSPVANLVTYSTGSLKGRNDVETYIVNPDGSITYHYSCDGGPAYICDHNTQCDIAPVNVVNPYTAGLQGNWRPSEDKVFEVNRTDQGVFNAPGSGPLVRKSGYFLSFTPYWYYDSANLKWGVATANAAKWISARYVTLYDKYGQELENHDALNRYSGAIYSFNGQLPAAVSSNAQQREMFYDAFDDYYFRNGCNGSAECDRDSFNIRRIVGTNYSSWLDSTQSHSGRYSLKCYNTITLNCLVHPVQQKTQPYLSTDSAGIYVRRDILGLYPSGFNPVAGKQYIFSAWINDGQPLTDNATGITVTVSGNITTTITLKRKATVEGWKLVEGTIDLSQVAPTPRRIQVVIQGGASIRLDDIRIFPFDAEMKTYSYDDQTLRLMAEMDENNFATFYEYDEEGTLVRLKKETDRGIMTIKETRSAYRKGQ
ncbi:hypothetical protein GA0116948_1265 [Chitinophaga costaii]|uniref:PA14 domain-containing protein n=1 Tax=Chitinophaga costaii TaxID=1335309 RepID=A0A1C4G7A8_9BACT|nr:hypothetical protein [Chitinophaga costaii]PUZ19536.1 hypothetical protein DCM91_20455 [Chitinophaga costaii]SCC64042.1 hypothetical protein GA0116948_1265 [Chitinophaga costaii]